MGHHGQGIISQAVAVRAPVAAVRLIIRRISVGTPAPERRRPHPQVRHLLEFHFPQADELPVRRRPQAQYSVGLPPTKKMIVIDDDDNIVRVRLTLLLS